MHATNLATKENRMSFGKATEEKIIDDLRRLGYEVRVPAKHEMLDVLGVDFEVSHSDHTTKELADAKSHKDLILLNWTRNTRMVNAANPFRKTCLTTHYYVMATYDLSWRRYRKDEYLNSFFKKSATVDQLMQELSEIYINDRLSEADFRELAEEFIKDLKDKVWINYVPFLDESKPDILTLKIKKR